MPNYLINDHRWLMMIQASGAAVYEHMLGEEERSLAIAPRYQPNEGYKQKAESHKDDAGLHT